MRSIEDRISALEVKAEIYDKMRGENFFDMLTELFELIFAVDWTNSLLSKLKFAILLDCINPARVRFAFFEMYNIPDLSKIQKRRAINLVKEFYEKNLDDPVILAIIRRNAQTILDMLMR